MSPFIEHLKSIIDERHLLKHPFYQAWDAGTLPLAALRTYAEQYYHLESAFQSFLSRMHAACDREFDVRQEITDNLHDEEHGQDNHRELWLRFGDMIGASRAAMESCAPLPETAAAVAAFKECASRSFLDGAGALAAYESQMPAVSQKKIEGLAKHYGLTDKRGTMFFDVHGILDIAHADAWWHIIDRHATTDADRARVAVAVTNGRDALWGFLDGVWNVVMP